MPEVGSEPWVSLIVQRVEYSDEGVPGHAIDRWGALNRQFSATYYDTFKVNDPLNVPEGYISAAGIAESIKVTSVKWMQEKYGGIINEKGQLIIEGP